MFIKKTSSIYGRIIKKPEKCQPFHATIDFDAEDSIPIQEQIEALRLKIALKEKYNRVLKEESQASSDGVYQYVKELYNSTRELRTKLIETIESEKRAVQNALRTHRTFQLAMSDKVPRFSICWLEDKLFDVSKRFNELIWRLGDKRKSLEEAEMTVEELEAYPRLGTLPFEQELHDELKRVEGLLEKLRVKKETASILNSKYYAMKFILLHERGRYEPILRQQEAQLRTLRLELKNLEAMLADAKYFREEAMNNLTLTEREASENRRARRRQLAKMKRAVQRVIEEKDELKNKQHQSLIMAPFRKPPQHTDTEISIMSIMTDSQINSTLMEKRSLIERYQDRGRKLMEIMRVSDLTFIPKRMNTVLELGRRLKAETRSKEAHRDFLIKQRDQLEMIRSQVRYSGYSDGALHDAQKEILNNAILETADENEKLMAKTVRLGRIYMNIRLSATSTLAQLDNGKRRRSSTKGNLPLLMNLIFGKAKRLLREKNELEHLFHDAPTKNYSLYIKNPPPPARLIRVGTPIVSDDSEEEEFFDVKVPTREEIKSQSARFIHQSLLKRGIKSVEPSPSFSN